MSNQVDDAKVDDAKFKKRWHYFTRGLGIIGVIISVAYVALMITLIGKHGFPKGFLDISFFIMGGIILPLIIFIAACVAWKSFKNN